ncbi:leucine rich repeat protein [Achlya hypogyna]|uniref:Leucine rich repeat protein n=1 Tax=Achlya hypogyna TaxID=1202772 RepID=A0A1V9YE43_ACHHY|nr:leucine rich repeat protein [Achlya hypogyna]
MFVVKDLRKIPAIMVDEADSREELRLGRRSAEFQGSLKVLCSLDNLPAFGNLRRLSLYDNQLRSVDRIGILANTPLAVLDLGYNHLTSLPAEIGALKNLEELWVTNNELEVIPETLLALPKLRLLQLSNNKLTTLPANLGDASSLQVLSLDNNKLAVVPQSIGQLSALVELNLRGNQLTELPPSLGNLASLEILSVNSNQLTALPVCLDGLASLKALFANGNPISHWPGTAFATRDAAQGALRVNFACTKIAEVPSAIASTWHVLTQLHITETDTKKDGHVVILSGTPYAAQLKKH